MTESGLPRRALRSDNEQYLLYRRFPLQVSPNPVLPLIAADVGGTHARFAIVSAPGAPVADAQTFHTTDFASFEAALGAYLGRLATDRPALLAIGAAGPLIDGKIALTNGTWRLDPAEIGKSSGFESVVLTNDLTVYAAGIAGATKNDLACLAPPSREPNDVIVIAQGTGLGAARYERHSGGVEIFPTEAGHLSFAPETEEEDNLLRRMRRVHPRPTFEHIASGSGLPQVYAALASKPARSLPQDGAGVVALADSGDEAAKTAIRLAAGSVATIARDLILAHGGADAIVIGGGLGRALESFWRAPEFLKRIRASNLPIDLGGLGLYLVTATGLPLKGAADLTWGRATCEHLTRWP
jgi:glucokinase